MSEKEIQEKFEMGFKYLQELEAIIKKQQVPFELHADRLAMLQFLAKSLSDLKTLELKSHAAPTATDEVTEAE